MIDGITYVPLSDIGMEREENQDYQGHDVTPHGLVFIVADGMGGHAGGATASQMTVNFMKRSLRETDLEGPAEALDYSIRAANRAIFEMAQRRPDLRGMGSTVVAVLMSGDVAWLAHVGDSRIYLLRDKQLMCLTKDHTMVQRMVDDGFLTEEDAENHPSSHVLSRSLGGRDVVEVEMAGAPLQLKEGDIFLLCSDGLTGLVRDGEIARTLLQYELHMAARLLVDEANARGGYDNSTIALVKIDSLPVIRPDAYEAPLVAKRQPPPPPSAGSNALQVIAVPPREVSSSADAAEDDSDEAAATAAADAEVEQLPDAENAPADTATAENSGEDSPVDDAETAPGEAEVAQAGPEEEAEASEEPTEGVEASADSTDEGDEDALPDAAEHAPTEEWTSVPTELHGLEDSLSEKLTLEKADEPSADGMDPAPEPEAEAMEPADEPEPEEMAPAKEPEPEEMEPAAEPDAAQLDDAEVPGLEVLPPAQADAWALPEDFNSQDEDSTEDEAAASGEAAEDSGPEAPQGEAEEALFAVDPEEETADIHDPDDPGEVTADIVVPDTGADTTAELLPAPRMIRPPADPLELAHKVIEVDDDGPRLTPHTRKVPPRTLTPIPQTEPAAAGFQHTTLLIVGVVAVTLGLLVGVFVGRAPISDMEKLVEAAKANETNLGKQLRDLRDVQVPALKKERDTELLRANDLEKNLEVMNDSLEDKEAEAKKLEEKIKLLEAEVEKLKPPAEETPAP